MCLISHSPSVAAKIGRQLAEVLQNQIRVLTWSMDSTPRPPAGAVDLYVASFPSVYQEALPKLPRGPGPASAAAPVIIAQRILSPVHFNKLLALPLGTRTLIAGNSRLACTVLLTSLHDYGIKHLKPVLHYPGHLIPETSDIRFAIVTGVNKMIPSWIESTIDIGVKELAFSTYYEIFKQLGIPLQLINRVATDYTRPIFKMTRRYYEESQKNYALVQCVNDAMFTIDAKGYVDVWNKAASALAEGRLESNRTHVSQVLPELRLNFPLEPGTVITDSLMRHQGRDYIFRLNPMGKDISGSVILIRQVSRIQELENMVRRELRRKGNVARYRFDDIVTESPVMKERIELARRFACTKCTVLLGGESGVGKELFAHSIHNASERADGPFVAINLAAMPEHLAESELFGYVGGSFTGARKGGQRGLFEEAHQGTIFLDEIGDAPLPLQIKLLRVLEEQEIRKIGSGTGVPVDVRVIAATNRPLDQMMRENTFRPDLFYRLCSCPLSIPALRERGNDVLLLALHFARQQGRTLCFHTETETFFKRYPWPGNVRELQNVVTYLLQIVPEGSEIFMRHLPFYLLRRGQTWALTDGDLPGQQERPSEEPGRNAENRLPGHTTLSEPQFALLKILARATSSLGRQRLLELLRNCFPTLSMYALRQDLRVLATQGFVIVGTTRQGCRVSSRGRLALTDALKARPSSTP